MSASALLPRSAPFSADEIDLLNGVVAKTTPLQRTWLSGFLAGLDAGQGVGIQPAQSPRPRVPLTILYASESGNAEGLALKARKLAQKRNFDVRVLDMADADPAALPQARNLIVFASTWGEGDPPQRAADFYARLMTADSPRLEGLRFSVLALGDTAYANFCATGRAIDERLEALGANRAAPRVDLDLDFARQAATWTEGTLEVLTPPEPAPSANIVHVDFKAAGLGPIEEDEPLYTADNPFDAEITARVDLNGTGSTRETWHVELAVDAGFTYRPGDAIGVVPQNDPALVEMLLKAVGLDDDAVLAQEFATRYDVTTLSRPLVDAYAKLTGRYDVSMLSVAESFATFAADRQLVDLFEAYPEKLTPEQLKGLLRPLPPRLYSVASSLKAHEGEAHVLVGAVRWASHGKARGGVTSTFLADRRGVGGRVPLFVKPNRHFRLPEDAARPIIMIGAGTGIAPYRAFIEERAETEGVGVGKSWLFFGERNFTYDFLYQLEWQDYLKDGVLSRIDVAFSRDQPEKIYVQQRLWERRDELAGWIEDGAHIYVCGEEKGMGRDVDAMLAKILAQSAGADQEAGRARLKELTRAGRYQRDVY